MECRAKGRNQWNGSQEDEYKRYSSSVYARKHPNRSCSHPKAADNAMRAAVGFREVVDFPIVLRTVLWRRGLPRFYGGTTVEALDQRRVRAPGRMRGTAPCVSTKAIMLMKSSRFSILRRRFRWLGATTCRSCQERAPGREHPKQACRVSSGRGFDRITSTEYDSSTAAVTARIELLRVPTSSANWRTPRVFRPSYAPERGSRRDRWRSHHR
jgi:hypothetical protein